MPKKKSFTQDNPALAFITGAGEEPQQPETQPEAQEPPTIRLPGTEPREIKAQIERQDAEPQKIQVTIERQTTEPRTVTLQYTQPEQPPEGYKFNPRFIEKKSKRFNALLKPSLFERVKAAAEEAGLSVNDLINQTLEAAFPEKAGEREDNNR